MNIDIRTISLAIGLSIGVTGIGLYFASGDLSPKVQGCREWSIGNLMGMVAFMLLAVREQVPEFISIVLANTMIYIGGVLYVDALHKFFEEKRKLWPFYLLGFGMFSGYLYYWAVAPNINARVAIISAVLTTTFFYCGTLIWKHRNEQHTASAIFTAVGFFVNSLISAVRGVLTLTPDYHLAELFTRNLLQDLAFLGYFISLLVTTFGFILMSNARLNAVLKIQATYDSLTGVMNRRSIVEALALILGEFKKNEQDLTILMIDVTRFKQVNDTYGHLVGDRVLEEIGAALQKNIREQDKVGRYGGDEFLALLPNTDEEEAGMIVDRLQKQAVSTYIPDLNDFVDVVLAVGAATLSKEDTSVENFINRADKALYAEKLRKKYIG